MFVERKDWRSVDEEEHREIIRKILLQADAVIRQIRTVASVSPLTLWENIFGFLLWQYHVMLNNPGTMAEAREDLNILKNDETWKDIAPRSLFATYLQGCEPSELLNTTVRTTCCLSKDVPGLIQCGFCPLK
jgi:ferric iron reductase protein FhuF